MQKLLLIKYDSNYADEFDVDGFVVWTEDKWEAHKAAVAAWFDKRAKKHGAKPELPPHNDPKYWAIYDQVRKWERGQDVERYFGTNEAVSYCDAEDYFRCFKTTEITQDEHLVLKRLFGDTYRMYVHYGMFLSLEDCLEDEEEEETEDEEEDE
jgi:hypothetical protein